MIDGINDFQGSLKQINFLVLDEADRLLSSGHFQEVEQILSVLNRSDADGPQSQVDPKSESKQHRQTLIFSATLQKDLQQRLAGKSKPVEESDRQQSMEYLLKKIKFREEKPKFIDVNPSAQMATGLKEGIIECPGTEKVSLTPPSLAIIPV